VQVSAYTFVVTKKAIITPIVVNMRLSIWPPYIYVPYIIA
jgi:hypothetical protein